MLYLNTVADMNTNTHTHAHTCETQQQQELLPHEDVTYVEREEIGTLKK